MIHYKKIFIFFYKVLMPKLVCNKLGEDKADYSSKT